VKADAKRQGRHPVGALIAVTAALAATLAAPAHGAPSDKKAIWGPATAEAFAENYCPLGAGIWQYTLPWDNIAPTRPANPSDPNDPAYHWPSELDIAIGAAQSCGIEVALMMIMSPPWANGGKRRTFPPKSNAAYARFATAVAARYPSVRHFMIWGEPSRAGNWALTKRTRRLRLTRKQSKAPRRYASLLDAAYASLKAVDPANVVIGGMTLTRGDIVPLAWIRAMRLPNGKPPRFDLYAHNPFTARNPNLKQKQLQRGVYDFSDLDSLAKEIDRNLVPQRKIRRGGRVIRKPKRRPKIYISEWTVPSDFTTKEFLGFYVSRQTQAKWLRSGLRIARSWKRLYTLGWFTLSDITAAHPQGPIGFGLLTAAGARKPSWYAYRDG